MAFKPGIDLKIRALGSAVTCWWNRQRSTPTYQIWESRLKTRELVFFLMALVIMGPLLGPGQILTLDSPLALNFNLAEYFSWSTDGAESVFAATHNSAPFAAVLRELNYFYPFRL